MTPDEAMAELRRWAKDKYGYSLTDQDLANITRAVGYSGGNVTPDMLEQAKAWADTQAAAMGMQPTQTATPAPTPTPSPEPSPAPTPAQGTSYTVEQAADLVRQWARNTYGYELSDAQIQRIAQGIGYAGGSLSQQQVDAAIAWADANRDTLLSMGNAGGTTVAGGGATGGGTTGGGSTGTSGSSGGGGGAGGGSNITPSTDAQFDQSDYGELQAWAINTFGRPASQAELNGIAKSIGYTGGKLTPQQKVDWKHYAIIEAKRQGWSPVGPGQLILPEFSEPELTGLPATPTYESFAAPTAPEYVTFQGPGAFQYGEFVAPTQESILADPGYKARLTEGQKALETSAAAKGLLRTGATLKGLSQYGQELASQEYGRAFERERTGYEANRSQAEKEWQSAYQSALDQYNAQRTAQESQYQNAYKSAYDMWKGAQEAKALTYTTASQDVKDKWAAAVQKARSDYNANVDRLKSEYQSSYDKWRFLTDDAYRRAQLASGKANF